MEQSFTKDQEDIMFFIAWTSGISASEITQEMKEQLYPIINQIPETSIPMILRIGSVLRFCVNKNQEWDIEFELKNSQEKIGLKIDEARSLINNFEVDDECKILYLDYAKMYFELENYVDDNDLLLEKQQALSDQINLIVAKESN